MTKIFNNEFLKIWLFSLDLPLMPISDKEESWSNELSVYKKYQFKFSRGYARFALSNLLILIP